MSYERISPPATQPSEDATSAVKRWCETWLRSDALRDLCRAFGGPNPSGLDASLDELVSFSASTWDFRGGRERNLAAVLEFDQPLIDQILVSADSLGLRKPVRPSQNKYDYVLVLGGLVRACVFRPRYAAQLLSDGIGVSEVAALGGFRALGGDEPGLAAAGGLGSATNEVEAMEIGLRRAFRLTDPIEEVGEVNATNPNLSWLTKTFRTEDGIQVRLVAAPSTSPETRRANTADTYQYWAERLVHLSPAARVLLVTSTIYVPYQGLEAIRMLAFRYGCGVETVGVDSGNADAPQLHQHFGPTNYLQEINSTIRAIRTIRDETRITPQ